MAAMRKSSRVIKPVIIWDPSDPGAPVIQVTDESNIKIDSSDSRISTLEPDTDTAIAEINNSPHATSHHDAHETSQSSETNIPIDSPWNITSVQDLEQFLYYSCPQCYVKTKTIEKFIQHAIGNCNISECLKKVESVCDKYWLFLGDISYD